MKSLSKKQEKLLSALVSSAENTFTPESCLFKKQQDFVEDKARFKTAVTTRRSGKSTACAVDLINCALTREGSVCLYITLSRNNAKKLVWPMLLHYNRTYKLSGVVNETDLSLTFPNSSVIYVSGASDKSEIEKFRGLAVTLCYLDEAQSFPGFIESLVDDVISPSLLDNNGTLCLIGTPGPIPAGYFHDCSQSEAWSHHFWSLFENPFIKKKSGKEPQELLNEELKRRGVDSNDPKIQREWFGRWVLDSDSLVYKYDRATCDYSEVPQVSAKWNYVVGIDLGFNDADAIAVLAYNEQLTDAYLVEEVVTRKQGITELVEQIQAVMAKYNPEKMVIDTGGLGKKIAEELSKRYQIPVIAAEKTRKFENIELLNDAMRTGRMRIKQSSRFAQDAGLVEWDRDKLKPDKLVISHRFHSDICEAVLYAFREVYHWLYEEPKKTHKAGTKEYYQQVAIELEAELERKVAESMDDKVGLESSEY